MTRRALMVVGLVLLPLCASCDALLGFLPPNQTTVRLVNNGDFEVQVELYVGDQQEVPRDVLTQTGTKLEYTVAAGGAASFSRDCDNLQAIVIDNAKLMVIGPAGPNADMDVLRDGSDFNCGDTIVFTFDHGPLFVDFNIAVSVVSQ
jgi:hypothetical protein